MMLKKIGKGLFTTAWRKPDGTVLLKSTCPAKEVMALGFFPNSKLFPVVKRVGFQQYEMKFYPHRSLRELNLRGRKLYNELRKLWFSTWDQNGDAKGLLNLFSSVTNKTAREALCGAVEALQNYGDDVYFEISPRNIRITEKGNLVLLDCFFFDSIADKQWRNMRYGYGN